MVVASCLCACYSVVLVGAPMWFDACHDSACSGTLSHGSIFGLSSGIVVDSGSMLATISWMCAGSMKDAFVGYGALHGSMRWVLELICSVSTLSGHGDGSLWLV